MSEKMVKEKNLKSQRKKQIHKNTFFFFSFGSNRSVLSSKIEENIKTAVGVEER